MLKQITTLTLAAATVFGLTIDVKLGKTKGEKYSVLNLESSEPFRCFKSTADDAPKNSFVCEFAKPPKAPFGGLKSEYFTVSQYGSGSYKLLISSSVKTDIFSGGFDPKTMDDKKAGLEKKSKKYTIVAYPNALPFVSPVKNPHINFPITLKTDPYIYIKTLDITGTPINDAGSLQDIAQYNKVKKTFDKGAYVETLALAAEAQKNSPNSIFTSEYELLRIKSLTELGGAANNTAAIDMGKKWLKNFSDDEKAPEALLALLNASARNQDFKNAEYYFERLTGDFGFLEISKQAMIDYADALRSGQAKRALELYKKALFESKTKETASSAAYKLADMHLSMNDPVKAKEYYGKILKGNSAFVLKDPEGAYLFAKKLAGAGIYDYAFEVAEATIDKLNKKSPSYETLLADMGEWGANAKETQKAESYFKRYFAEYPEGKLKQTVEARLDKLRFEADKNMSASELVKLADKYSKDIVGQKALLKTMQTLFEAKRYDDVLALEPKTSILGKELAPQAKDYVLKSEKESISQKLASNSCKEAVALASKNRVTLTPAEEPKLFDCMISVGEAPKAYEYAKKRTAVADLKAKLPWLYKFESAAYKIGKTKEAYDAAKDVLALSRVYKTDAYWPIVFDASALALEYKDSSLMNEALAIVDARYGSDPKSISAYKSAARLAVAKNDALSNLRYSEKLYNLQNRLKIYVETPWTEFNYAAALSKSGSHRKAAQVLESALGKKLTNSDKTRALFEISSNYVSLGDKATARKYLNQCLNVEDSSSWKGLCKESLDILK